MAPSDKEVTAAMDQLDAWAKMWGETMADTASNALSAANNLALSKYDFSFAGGGCAESYARFFGFTQRRLTDARDTFTWVGGQLKSAATAYRTDERNAVHRMTNTW